jgi:hypothetical protein
MRQVLRDTLRVLFFRASGADIDRLDRRHLLFGLACTWLVGIGRSWDDPRANFLQHTGLGSVVYVFVLSLILFASARPVTRFDVSYRQVLTYVTLTAPPALLYAIPIERWTDIPTARGVNVWFLSVVATWRVALYIAFLVRALGLKPWMAVCTSLLPITLVIALLAFLNVERAVFDVMGGLRGEGTPHDGAYMVLVTLTSLSVLASPLLLILWGIGVVSRRKAHAEWRRTQSAEAGRAPDRSG